MPANRRRIGSDGAGVIFSLSAYGLWGVLPLYFVLLAPSGPWEVVAWRVLLSLVFCALLLTVARGWGRFLAVLRSPRLALTMGVAGLLIYVNWQTFLAAALTEHVIEASLGYFINPIMTVLLAVLVLHERLRPLQWTAIGLALLAVVVIVVGYGAVPWYALILSISFGVYGLVKKKTGADVDAVSGLALETLWLVPVAAVQLAIVASTTGVTMGTAGPLHTVLLLSAGVVTAVPLLLFAAGARRVSLTTVGLLQFIAPILQFVIGAAVLHEPMPLERWIGFAIVWLALAVLTADQVRHARRPRPPVPLA
ncbi:EamA family transporter RarD [Microbacterium album]|uniref:EamA family transporter RarD n=1 Tax=Microbacterium album TaxID=2053191 RepID=UPI0035711DDB